MKESNIDIFISSWHQIFEDQSFDAVLPLLSEDITFFSPAIYEPKRGKKVVAPLLGLAFKVLKDYKVTQTWIEQDKVLFEFEANVKGYTIQGIDIITLNAQGKVKELKVFIRPLTGLMKTAETIQELISEKSL